MRAPTTQVRLLLQNILLDYYTDPTSLVNFSREPYMLYKVLDSEFLNFIVFLLFLIWLNLHEDRSPKPNVVS